MDGANCVLFSTENLEARRNEYSEAAFIVVRLDTQQVTCVSKHMNGERSVVPSYDLGQLLK